MDKSLPALNSTLIQTGQHVLPITLSMTTLTSSLSNSAELQDGASFSSPLEISNKVLAHVHILKIIFWCMFEFVEGSQCVMTLLQSCREWQPMRGEM